MEPILSLKNVCSYYDKVQVLYDINDDVYPGEIVSVIGANGAGKSTMMPWRKCWQRVLFLSLPVRPQYTSYLPLRYHSQYASREKLF